ncbi:MAG: TonB-dependent receptor [Acidobacteria bacterium]|nr:TonB-dependent receptor [Acidobacteriota bacterium]
MRILRPLAIVFAVRALAQTPNAQITGLVTDPTGAVMAGVKVTVTDVDRRQDRATETNESGSYRVLFLGPGNYRVSLEKSGFKPVVRPGVTLAVDQVARLDFALEVGATSERVEVLADTPLLDAETSSLGQVIDNKRIVELPMNGRNIMSLVQLSAGVQPLSGINAGFSETGNFSASNLSMNGGRGSLNALLLDGANNAAPEREENAVSPSVDAVEEFKVYTNGASAEFGRTAGGVISIVTKSGTNELHGTLYEFLRNDRLDSRDAFASARGVLRYNQFGGTTGGPVYVPKLYNGKDRTFFFFSYEGYRNHFPANRLNTVPTPAQREGDFSNTRLANGNLLPIYDPLSTRANPAGGFARDLFPANRVPTARFDRISRAIVDQRVPLPNRAPANPVTNVQNFFQQVGRLIDNDQWMGRFDHNLTSNHRVMYRLTYNRNIVGGDRVWTQSDDEFVRNYQQAVASWTHTLSPRMVGDFRAGYVLTVITRHPQSSRTDVEALNYPAVLPRLHLPQHVIADFTTIGGNSIVDGGLSTISASETLTRTMGSHTLKFGGEARAIRRNRYQFGGLNGTFNFNRDLTGNPQQPANTGYGVATFLLGAVNAGNITVGEKRHERGKYYAAFVQDDWRVGRRLTLNIGLRYDVETPPVDIYNQKSNFNLDRVNPVTGVPGVLEYAGVNFGRSPVPVDFNNWGPRLGFAYTVEGSTVIRSSYGIFYQPDFTTFESNQGWSATTPFNDPSIGPRPTFYLSEGPRPGSIISPPGSSLGDAGFLGQGVSTRLGTDRTPYVQQWSFGVQRALPGDWSVEAVYTGSKGTKLGQGGDNDDINELPPQFLSQGLALQQQVANPFFRAGAFGATVPRSQLLLPYPAYRGVSVTAPHWGSSIYHGLQFTARRRFRSGFSLLASFTAGKLIDDMAQGVSSGFTGFNQGVSGTQSFYNRRAERSISPGDIARRLVISGIYTLPFGRGQRWVKNGIASWIIGGWQLAGTNTLAGGVPVAIRGAQNFAADRPNSLGRSGELPRPERTAGRWFDTSAFSLPPLYTFGNVGRVLPDTRGPGVFQLDASIHKFFPLGERFRVQLRGEAFNATNMVNLGMPNVNMLATDFGRIGGTQTPARIIQVGAKVIF